MKYDQYDLLLVGSSFAATFFLKKYLGKAPSTAKILVLERGHLFPHSERLKEKRGLDTPFANLNGDFRDSIINNTPQKPWFFQNGFGGGSNCWYGCTPRFLPNDFRMKTLYGIAADWPFGYEELEPYYTEAEEIMSISGPSETPFPKQSNYPLPPHAFTAPDHVLKKQYGNLYISQPTARASAPTRGRGVCCASSVCSVCPANAKFTIENSQMGVYEDARVELVYGAQVYGLELEGNTVNGVLYEKDGVEKHVAAEVVALGANSIFNAHILLNSGDENKHTGRGLGEQVGMQVDVFLNGLKSLGGSTWVNANGYMLYDGDHRKDYAGCLMESSNFPFVRVERGKWRNMASFRMIFEDLPDENNFVAPSDNRLMPEVTYAGPTAYALQGIEHMKQKLPEILACLPVEYIQFQQPFHSEAHILGTTRMSNNAMEGVVDRHLIHHQYRNLFVLGSGTFTTFTPANPTLTLSALSLFAADKSF